MILSVSFIVNIIIFLSFLGNFGFWAFDQQIYFYYVFEILLILVLFFKNKLKINSSFIESKLLIFFFILIFISAVVGVFGDVEDYGSQSITYSSLKGMIYISLNIFMIFLIITYCRNEKFFFYLKNNFKYLIIFYLIFFALESYHDFYSKNEFIREILSFFHTSSRSIDKDFINLLGHEHSNSAIFVLILYAFMVANFLNKNKVFDYYLIDLIVIILLISAIFLLKSKLGYLIFALLSIAIIFINLKFKNLLKLFLLIIIIYLFLIFFFKDIIKAQNIIFNYNHPSFNIRLNLTLASIYLMIENPILGIGLNNFKFYFVDAIYGLQNIVWLDIKTIGPDLEFEKYAIGGTGGIGAADPFNFIFGLGAEAGTITLIIFLFLIIKVFFRTFRLLKKNQLNKTEKSFTQFLIFSNIIIGMSYTSFYQLYFLLQWIIIGINILFYYYIYEKYKL